MRNKTVATFLASLLLLVLVPLVGLAASHPPPQSTDIESAAWAKWHRPTRPHPTVTSTTAPTTSVVTTSPTTATSPTPTTTTSSATSATSTTPQPTGWPGPDNTGVPAGTVLHACPDTITTTGTYDACFITGGLTVKASNVTITRSLITGGVATGSGDPGEQTGLVISDSTLDCGCLSQGSNDTPSGIMESNYTLLRVNLMHSGHGAAVKSNVVIQDSWIHDLGGNTEAHKDGIYVGDGTNVVIRHNNIECNDGPLAGCTSAIGLLTDFGNISYYTIDNNLLNTIGSYCLYAAGGPSKAYTTDHLTVTNNHFGRKDNPNCGYYGPVAYFDAGQPGMVWSGNVWDDTGALVAGVY